MSMFDFGKNRKDARAGMQPVHSIEISSKNKRLRIILAIVALIVAIVMFAIVLTNLLTKQSGWQTIKVSSPINNCSSEFVLQYDLGRAGASATVEHRQILELYTQATARAYRVFHKSLTEDGLGNLALINANPNTVVTVDPLLYQSLEKISKSGNRTVYLAEVVSAYGNVFSSESESEALQHDPTQDEELKAYVQELAQYAADAQHVNLVLLGSNSVRMDVSDAYRAVFEEYELVSYLDFGWLKNAFIADYLAQTLMDGGFTNGYLVSVDGFTRNLDASDTAYSVNIFHRNGVDVYKPAEMTYRGAISMVNLRDFPQVEEDRWRCFVFSDGRAVSTFVDPTDGMSKSSVDSILAYSKTATCADIALSLSDIYIAKQLEHDALLDLSGKGIVSIWCENDKLYYSEKTVDIKLVDSKYSAHHLLK